MGAMVGLGAMAGLAPWIRHWAQQDRPVLWRRIAVTFSGNVVMMCFVSACSVTLHYYFQEQSRVQDAGKTTTINDQRQAVDTEVALHGSRSSFVEKACPSGRHSLQLRTRHGKMTPSRWRQAVLLWKCFLKYMGRDPYTNREGLADGSQKPSETRISAIFPRKNCSVGTSAWIASFRRILS